MKKKSSSDKKINKDLEKLFEGRDESIDKAVRSLKVIAHPVRLKILCILRHGEQNVQSLENFIGISQAGLSQHLSTLKDRGILVSRREGSFSLYQIADDRIIDLFELIYDIYCD